MNRRILQTKENVDIHQQYELIAACLDRHEARALSATDLDILPHFHASLLVEQPIFKRLPGLNSDAGDEMGQQRGPSPLKTRLKQIHLNVHPFTPLQVLGLERVQLHYITMSYFCQAEIPSA